MKLPIFILCCFALTMHYSAEGGLVKDFFGKVKETAEVVHKDVQHIWRPESANNKKETPENSDKSATVSTTSAAEIKNKEDTIVTEKTPQESDKTPDDSASPAKATAAAAQDTENKHVETTTISTSTTTKKEGRENFTGACQTGYKRTSDGRCMASI